MIISPAKTFLDVFDAVNHEFIHRARLVHTEKWQGYDIRNRPEAAMHELTNIYFCVDMPGEDLDTYRRMLVPNLPWADRHFEERLCGEPRNPGETWKDWPWALKADHARRFDGRFSQTYMERYWPRFAGSAENHGIRFRYGDLNDVVNLLNQQPLTRQAYLPIFFPEDTGAHHGDRVPCTLGYHWLVRDKKIHTFYPIRSCDYYRHFRDDVYLTCRLTLWLLDTLRERNDFWKLVQPGEFSMWIGSLHLFRNDYIRLFEPVKLT